MGKVRVPRASALPPPRGIATPAPDARAGTVPRRKMRRVATVACAPASAAPLWRTRSAACPNARAGRSPRAAPPNLAQADRPRSTLDTLRLLDVGATGTPHDPPTQDAPPCQPAKPAAPRRQRGTTGHRNASLMHRRRTTREAETPRVCDRLVREPAVQHGSRPSTPSTAIAEIEWYQVALC